MTVRVGPTKRGGGGGLWLSVALCSCEKLSIRKAEYKLEVKENSAQGNVGDWEGRRDSTQVT